VRSLNFVVATSSVLELLEQFIRWASFVLHSSVIEFHLIDLKILVWTLSIGRGMMKRGLIALFEILVFLSINQSIKAHL